MEYLRACKLNMRDQKLNFRRHRQNIGGQKSPKLPLDLRVIELIVTCLSLLSPIMRAPVNITNCSKNQVLKCWKQ